MMVVIAKYMDGAVESGMRAAGEVLRNIEPLQLRVDKMELY